MLLTSELPPFVAATANRKANQYTNIPPAPGTEYEPIYKSNSSAEDAEGEVVADTPTASNSIRGPQNLSSMGFTTISRKQYEEQKLRAANTLGPFLEPDVKAQHVGMRYTHRIPRKPRRTVEHSQNTPVPRRVPAQNTLRPSGSERQHVSRAHNNTAARSKSSHSAA